VRHKPSCLFLLTLSAAFVRSDQWLDWLKVLSFDWSEFFVPGACLVGGFKSRILLRGIVPLFLMLVPLVISVAPYLILCWCARVGVRTDRAQTPFGEGLKAAALRALPYVILISFCMVQSVSTGTFSAWDCVEFVLDSTTGAKQAFLREDLSVECKTDQHAQVQTIAVVFLVIWPVGMTLLYVLLLLTCRRAIEEKRPTPLARATFYLHQEYSSHFFWWECLFLLERVAVSGWHMLFFEAHRAIQRIMFGFGITVVYMVALLTFRPYARRELNFLAAIGAQMSLTFIIFVTLWMRVFDEIKGVVSIEVAREIMDFDPSQVCKQTEKSSGGPA
jgi:hypothetical protein